MRNISFYGYVALLIVGLGVIYFSRFCLRDCQKLTGKGLEKIDSRFGNIKQKYLWSNTAIVLLASFISLIVYLSNKIYWADKVFTLAVPIFAIGALFDGLFAIRTGIFPTSTKYTWDSFVYDAEGEFRWVANWQITLSIALLIIDLVLLILTKRV